jgi:hypothetical protein
MKYSIRSCLVKPNVNSPSPPHLGRLCSYQDDALLQVDLTPASIKTSLQLPQPYKDQRTIRFLNLLRSCIGSNAQNLIVGRLDRALLGANRSSLLPLSIWPGSRII